MNLSQAWYAPFKTSRRPERGKEMLLMLLLGDQGA